MNSSKKFINQILPVVFLLFFFSVPDLAIIRIFDRVVAKVNTEIITLSSVEERVVILKQKYKNELDNHDEKDLLKEAIDMMVAEKLQLQQGKKIGLLVEDSAVEAALKNIEKKNGRS